MRARGIIRFLAGALVAATATFAAPDTPWTKVEGRYFTVVTPAGPAVARAWATEFEQFRRALLQIVPIEEDRLRPVTIVLFQTDRAMQPFKPLERGRPQDIAGMFGHFADSHAIALALDAPPATIRQILYHEAVHWHSAAGNVEMPQWLEEGLAEVYSTFKVKGGDTCVFGTPLDPHLQYIRRHGLRPVGGHVTTGPHSLSYNDGNRASVFYAQSWLMVHYLLFGKDAPGEQGIARYLAALPRSPDLESAFRAGFGSGYKEFQDHLDSYMRRGEYRSRSFRMPSTSAQADFQVGAAHAADVERALAVLLLAGRKGETATAEARLRRAVQLVPGDAESWQTLAAIALTEHRRAEALEWFNRAVAAGTKGYYAHYGRAVARLMDSDQTVRLGDAADATASAADLRIALQRNPRFIPAYEGLAGLMFATDPFEPGDRVLLERGRALSPGNAMIEVGMGACEIRGGNAIAGRERIRVVLEETAGISRDTRRLAEDILRIDDWNRFSAELDTLFRNRRYEEALALLERMRPRFADARFRTALSVNRLIATSAIQIDAAVRKANGGDTAGARAILQGVLASEADSMSKSEARRLLVLLR